MPFQGSLALWRFASSHPRPVNEIQSGFIMRATDVNLMHGHGHVHGHWGNITSNIVWCEDKYTVSFYIAEFWNTISNLPFLLLGLFQFMAGLKLGVPLRLNICNLILVLVYTGSALFHGTLLYEMQLLDELPMMLLISQSLYCLLLQTFPSLNAYAMGVAAFIYSFAILGSIFYLFYSIPIVFHLLFGSVTAVVVFVSFYRAWLIKGKSHPQRSAKLALLKSVILTGCAFGMWLYDNTFCDHLRSARAVVGELIGAVFQFHSWWHLLTGVGSLWYIAGLSALIDQKLVVESAYVILPRLRLRKEVATLI